MKFFKYFTVISLLIISVLYSQPNIIADSHEPDDSVEFQDDDSHDRELSVDLSTDEIRLEAELKNGTTKDKFRVEMKLDSSFPDDNSSGEVEIRFKYQQESNSTEVTFQYRVEFTDIIEYIENGTEFGYQEGEEVGTYNIGGTGWNDVLHVIETVVSGNVTDDVHVFTATTLDNVVSFVVRVAGSVVELGNGTLTPNSVKLDVIIKDYAYLDSNSNLAIKSKVKSTTELSVEQESAEESLGVSRNEKEIKLKSNGTQGYFSWSDVAQADGVTVGVIDSPLSNVIESDDDVLEGEDNIKMFFSFNATNPSEIIWDPKVGVIAKDIILPSATEPNTSSTSQISSGAGDTSVSTSPSNDDTSVTTVPTEDKSEDNDSPGFGFFFAFSAIFFIGVLSQISKRSKRK